MSACSSQLSASLLGSELTDNADSAARSRTTPSNPRRSVSASRSAALRHSSKSSKQTVHRTCSDIPGLQSPAQSSASTPRSGQPAKSPAMYVVESVASQGHARTRTPECTASTGKSQAVPGKSHSSKASWQQATASSRSSQPKHSVAPSQQPKSSFLARLQDSESSKGPKAAPRQQLPQQPDAKAAEMKAKLLEWRQQQQQQKLQRQQPAPKQQHAPAAVAAKRKQQMPAVKLRASSVDAAYASTYA